MSVTTSSWTGRRCVGLATACLFALALISVAFPARAQDEAAEAGFEKIFNGKSLTGWDGNPKFWSVEDEAIVGQTTPDNPTKGNTFLIWRDGEVDDFELRLKYRITNGNSGIQYRSRDLGDWVVGGYQADIDSGDTFSGILYDERGKLGVVAERGQKVVIDEEGNKKVVGSLGERDELQKVIKKEDWNDYRIVARGNHVKHYINGQQMIDVVDQREEAPNRGVLALQLHAGPPMKVEFKNVRLKRLEAQSRAARSEGGEKKIVFVAGKPSHGPGEHEHNAGAMLLAECLQELPGIRTKVYRNGWPEDPDAFEGADAIVIFSDGGAGHPAIQGNNLEQLREQMDQGVGLALLHYAVEVPKERAGKEFLEWVGGYFETYWSVNPHWTANFTKVGKHPITRGVEPFEIHDEWYYHMRFRPNMEGVTPILTAIPPESTLERPDGPHSGNPHVRAKVGQPQHVAWAAERPNGARGFGFTGAHFHKNWGNPNFRKVVLNALLWTAGGEVPPEGIACEVTEEDLKKNLDEK